MSIRLLLPYLHLLAFSDWSRPLNAAQIRDVIGGVVLLGTVGVTMLRIYVELVLCNYVVISVHGCVTIPLSIILFFGFFYRLHIYGYQIQQMIQSYYKCLLLNNMEYCRQFRIQEYCPNNRNNINNIYSYINNKCKFEYTLHSYRQRYLYTNIQE